MSLSDICSSYVKTAKLKDDTERNIIEFAEAPWGLGMGTTPEVPPLFAVQKFIFKCYYNIPLDNSVKNIIVRDKFNEQDRFRFTEIEYLKFLGDEGRINIKEVTGDPKDSRPNLLLVIGRRGTKTSTIAVLVAFETYKLLKKASPQSYYNIMPDQEIRVSCVATNQEQAAELFRMITGHLDRSDYFRRYRNKPTASYMQLNTERDIERYNNERPSLRVVASPCSGRGLRGRNNIIAILDEMAFFFEDESSVDKSDRTVYDAVTPSTARFVAPNGNLDGRVIGISSPGSRSGVFYEEYQRSLEKDCSDILMIQAPSWEVDHTLSSKYLRAKYSSNPNSYEAEFGAKFTDKMTAWIENEQYLRLNVISGLRFKERSYERLPHFIGIDIGLKTDGSAIAITHIIRKEVGGVMRDFIELDAADVRYAEDEGKEHFRPEELSEWIASYVEKFFIVKGIMDQYFGMSIIPLLNDRGIRQIESVPVSRDYSSKVFQNLMSKMLDGSLLIPEGDEKVIEGQKVKDIPLVTELLSLQAEHHSKYLITVEAPQVKGMHDDMSDAFARSVFLATEYMTEGGSARNVVTTAAGSGGASYMKYYRKEKRGVLYTNRPSSTLQREMFRSRSIASPFRGR